MKRQFTTHQLKGKARAIALGAAVSLAVLVVSLQYGMRNLLSRT